MPENTIKNINVGLVGIKYINKFKIGELGVLGMYIHT